MSVLITGGTGFLGSYIARKLVESGEDKPILMDSIPFPAAVGDILDRVEIVNGDYSEPSQLMAVFKKYDISCVFHLAFVNAPDFEHSPSRAIRVNCEGAANLFEMARVAGVRRVVWPASAAIFPSVPTSESPEFLDENATPAPPTMYGVCKLFDESIAELYAEKFGLDHIGLRLNSIYGLGRVGRRGLGGGGAPGRTPPPGSGDIFAQLVERAVTGQTVTTPPLNHRIYWSYVKDCADAFYAAYKAPKPKHRILNFSGEVRTIADAVACLKNIAPKAEIVVGTKPAMVIPFFKTDLIRTELGFEPHYTMEQGMMDYARLMSGSS